MNRREFVKFLAALTVGVNGMPQQLEAFERYYEMNTPNVATGLVSVDEIMLSGMATRSIPADFRIYSGTKQTLNLGLNLFGGVIRWVAAPDQKIQALRDDFNWIIHPRIEVDEFPCIGHISYIDQDANGLRRYQQINGSGNLVA